MQRVKDCGESESQQNESSGELITCWIRNIPTRKGADFHRVINTKENEKKILEKG
jgi:uncharacterized protein YbaA (DUF1428 family)